MKFEEKMEIVRELLVNAEAAHAWERAEQYERALTRASAYYKYDPRKAHRILDRYV